MRILTTLFCALLVSAAPLRAADRGDMRVLGVVTAIAGAGMIVGAFNYKKDCDDGYRSVYETGFRSEYATYDYCTTFAGNTVTTRETPVDISLKRPKLLYSGIGACDRRGAACYCFSWLTSTERRNATGWPRRSARREGVLVLTQRMNHAGMDVSALGLS